MAALGTLIAMLVGCTASAPSATGPRGARDFAEYAAAACAALQSIWRGYGNPDTSEMSALQRSFDAAVEIGDVTTAAARADEVRTELERGRASASVAGAWSPGAASMVQVDRFLLALEAMVDARLAAVPAGYRLATDRGQAAFEAAGGIDAWYGMLTGIDAAMKAAGQPWPACEGVPIGGGGG
jgi:hypothetical protein